MSEFTTHQQKRLEDLTRVFHAVTYKNNPVEAINTYRISIDNAIPDDMVILVHQIVESGMPMPEIKSGVSKMLNVLHKSMDNFPVLEPDKGSFFESCIQNNKKAIEKLNDVRPLVVQMNKEKLDANTKAKMIAAWQGVQKHTDYYEVKEHVLFPLVEKYLADYKCISVMWSIHDDLRKNVKNIIEMLSIDNYDLKTLNKIIGEAFYNVYTMVYREEKLLYPFILKNIPQEEIEKAWNESVEVNFPYINPPKKSVEKSDEKLTSDELNMKSGLLTLEQIILIFNHLPVDITYVDENNKVRFFSTPKKRIFTRTNAIIGRDVRNCHPHESVHVVEKIVESFRDGTKNQADFWINMKGNKILIQYFAVRNENGDYKGVIEVTQEISDIQKLEGERRILDWER